MVDNGYCDVLAITKQSFICQRIERNAHFLILFLLPVFHTGFFVNGGDFVMSGTLGACPHINHALEIIQLELKIFK